MPGRRYHVHIIYAIRVVMNENQEKAHGALPSLGVPEPASARATGTGTGVVITFDTRSGTYLLKLTPLRARNLARELRIEAERSDRMGD